MIEDSVREAIVSELGRQAEKSPERLQVTAGESTLEIRGEVDIDELVMAILGAVAGGP